ncbi:TrmH family RNA methyltransferase [Gorillibacterium sp. sgz5001074]|uniref:TrmH family RNA methyltransferase n=1 Tax=Gorillibacterium sp. sgz5001074 TaxID=3446695 RepID=UPI003F67F518
MEITSVSNPRVKAWSQLLAKRGREEQGAFLLEGIHLTLEAFRSNVEILTVLYDMERGIPPELIEYAQPPQRSEWIGVTSQVLAKCTETQSPQGVVAVCRKLRWTAEDILSRPDALVVAVDGVQDPGNLGTIIRSADAVGADGVILGRGTVDLYNPKTVRATMGSLFHVPVADGELRELLPAARERGIRLVGTRLEASRNCYELDLTEPVWLLMGNEGSGLAADIAAFVDTDVLIPMRGKAESLNVAMAASVLLYEAMRQRHYRR